MSIDTAEGSIRSIRWLRTFAASAAACALLITIGCSSETHDAKTVKADAKQDKSPLSTKAGEAARVIQDAGVTEQPSPIFVDATDQAGIDFVHFNGTTGEFFLPEITGSGGGLFDFDNDGDLDLYVVQGAYLQPPEKSPDPVKWQGDQPPTDRLFRNELIPAGQLRFTDVTEQCGIHAPGYGMGVATGDYNNDGWIDLYVTNLGANQLWRNNGGNTFTDVTQEAGTDDPRWSTSAAFVDYDRDGWLDLFFANYVDFSTSYRRNCFSTASARDYCGPTSYDDVPDKLFRNRGDGTFEDVTIPSGIAEHFGSGLGVVTADFNNDHWPDLYVANDGDPNQMWINAQGKGTFEDNALLGGTALNRMGQAEAGMGVDAADFDSDGDEDLFMTHLERESNTLYENLGNGLFEDRTIESGLHAASLPYTSFGTRFVDYDNDGLLDLLVLNGAVRVIEAQARAGVAYPLTQPNQLFQNRGGEKFVEVTKAAGPALAIAEVSRGAALGDVDNDGDVDVVVFNNNGRTRLLLNQIGNRNHWLGLRVLDPELHRDALQARVEVVTSLGKSQWYRVHTDGSYCSAGDPRIVSGLGADTNIKLVRVHWPDGGIELWPDLEVDRYHILQRGQGTASSATLPSATSE